MMIERSIWWHLDVNIANANGSIFPCRAGHSLPLSRSFLSGHAIRCLVSCKDICYSPHSYLLMVCGIDVITFLTDCSSNNQTVTWTPHTNCRLMIGNKLVKTLAHPVENIWLGGRRPFGVSGRFSVSLCKAVGHYWLSLRSTSEQI